MKVDAVLRSKGSAVLTAWPSVSIRSVAERMASANVGALVVIDADGVLVGVISERDIIKALARSGESAMTQAVSQVMSKAVLTCSPDDHLRVLMEVMTRQRVRHLPVVDNGALVGMISIGDLVKARLEELETESNVLRDAYLRTR